MSKRNPDHDPWDRYFTHPKLAARIVEFAQVERGMRILEPSAGRANLLASLKDRDDLEVTALDILEEQVQHIQRTVAGWALRVSVQQADFIRWRPPHRFDLALMNPPFTDGRDCSHVCHALRFCDRVVCLVTANFLYGVDRYHAVMANAYLKRQAIQVRRPPPFGGPGDLGHTPQKDYTVLELVKRPHTRGPGDRDHPELEFWL